MPPADVIAHHREGTGTPLVLVHGIAASWECWKPVLPFLAARHDVIAVDLPGFGDSVRLGEERPSLEGFARSILALLDSLGIEEFHISGNSLGGAVSAAVADVSPDRVLSYTGISAAGQTYGQQFPVTKTLLRGSYYGSRLIRPIAPQLAQLRPLRMAFLAQMVGRPQRLTSAYAADLIVHCADGSGFERTLRHAIPDGPMAAPRWDGPAQMLWGTRDAILPISALDRWTRVWPALQPIRMPGLGHVPMQDDPQLVARHLLDLTASVDAPPAHI